MKKEYIICFTHNNVRYHSAPFEASDIKEARKFTTKLLGNPSYCIEIDAKFDNRGMPPGTRLNTEEYFGLVIPKTALQYIIFRVEENK